MPYAPLENLTLEQAITLASQNRSDLKAAEAQMHAAELSRKAAIAERYPTLGIERGLRSDRRQSRQPRTARSPSRASSGFPSGREAASGGDIEQADAALQQRRAEYEDLRARVEADVRTAYLDLNAAADQVRVAQSQRELAEDELAQARDRFASGVADTVEVVQAQEMVSTAEQDYIASLSAHNLAKASVARATGQAGKNHAQSSEESIIMAVDQLQTINHRGRGTSARNPVTRGSKATSKDGAGA